MKAVSYRLKAQEGIRAARQAVSKWLEVEYLQTAAADVSREDA